MKIALNTAITSDYTLDKRGFNKCETKTYEQSTPIKRPPNELLSVYFTGSEKFSEPSKYESNHRHKLFKEKQDFSNGKFNGSKIDFHNTTFLKKVSFENSKFFGDVITFDRALFDYDANFNGAQMSAEKINFLSTEFENNAKFNNTKFIADYISLSGANIGGNAFFANSEFKANDLLKMDYSIFQELADFSLTRMTADKILFDKAEFNSADFTKSSMTANSISFFDTLFTGDTDFTDTTFNANKIYFDNIIIEEKLNFNDTIFNGEFIFAPKSYNVNNINFNNAIFNKGADLSGLDKYSIQRMLKGAKYKSGTEKLFKLPEGVEFKDLGLDKCKTSTQSKHDKIDELLDKLISTTDPNEKIKIESQLARLSK